MGIPQLTGIDFGRYSIKAVVVKPAKQHCTILACHELTVEEALFCANHELKYQDSVNKLKQLNKKLPGFRRYAAIPLPSHAVICKPVSLDIATDSAGREALIADQFAAQSPCHISELYLDYVAQPSGLEVKESYQVYATKRHLVDNRTEIVKAAGLRPLVVDTQAHALLQIWHLAAAMHRNKHWLLVDIGVSQAIVCAAPEQGQQIVQVVHFSIAQQQTAQQQTVLPQNPQPPTSAHSSNHVDTHFAEFLDKLESLMVRIASSAPEQIEGLWLTGGNAAELIQAIQVRIKLPVESLDLGGLVKTRCQPPASHYATALGAALGAWQWLEAHADEYD
ncbi:pilus assembly protein PilM [Vibrio sp. WXL210]|uniref:pilus assembly protein PilM n=1 Tax=Vibrio sp. WXL210 TaxID=3450709 RepID=UPI003EC4DB99